MATSLTPATLTVKITEAINLNGQPIDSENTLTISSITNIDKRLVTLPVGSEVTIVDFAAQVAAGTFIRDNFKYFRITNKDQVNYARIRMKKNGADTFDQRLEAGQSFIASKALLSVSATAAAFTGFVEADRISGQAYNGNIDVEYFLASL